MHLLVNKKGPLHATKHKHYILYNKVWVKVADSHETFEPQKKRAYPRYPVGTGHTRHNSRPDI